MDEAEAKEVVVESKKERVKSKWASLFKIDMAQKSTLPAIDEAIEELEELEELEGC